MLTFTAYPRNTNTKLFGYLNKVRIYTIKEKVATYGKIVNNFHGITKMANFHSDRTV